jgi:hypothetical protein
LERNHHALRIFQLYATNTPWKVRKVRQIRDSSNQPIGRCSRRNARLRPETLKGILGPGRSGRPGLDPPPQLARPL